MGIVAHRGAKHEKSRLLGWRKIRRSLHKVFWVEGPVVFAQSLFGWRSSGLCAKVSRTDVHTAIYYKMKSPNGKVLQNVVRRDEKHEDASLLGWRFPLSSHKVFLVEGQVVLAQSAVGWRIRRCLHKIPRPEWTMAWAFASLSFGCGPLKNYSLKTPSSLQNGCAAPATIPITLTLFTFHYWFPCIPNGPSVSDTRDTIPQSSHYKMLMALNTMPHSGLYKKVPRLTPAVRFPNPPLQIQYLQKLTKKIRYNLLQIASPYPK